LAAGVEAVVLIVLRLVQTEEVEVVERVLV
jgi:hypothetical protein